MRLHIIVEHGKIEQAFERDTKKISAGLREIVARTARDVREEAKDSIKKSKGGYRRYYHHKVGWTTSSWPGTPPRNQSGQLLGSISQEFTEFGDAYEGRVTATAHYAAYLEFGTRKMAKRPYLRPALEKHEQPFYDAVQNMVKNVFGM